jgi:hypothetical protein
MPCKARVGTQVMVAGRSGSVRRCKSEAGGDCAPFAGTPVAAALLGPVFITTKQPSSQGAIRMRIDGGRTPIFVSEMRLRFWLTPENPTAPFPQLKVGSGPGA